MYKRWLNWADRLRQPVEVLAAESSLLYLLRQGDALRLRLGNGNATQAILAALTPDKVDDEGIDFFIELVTVSLTDNARVLSPGDMKHGFKLSFTTLGRDARLRDLTLIGLHLQ